MRPSDPLLINRETFATDAAARASIALLVVSVAACSTLPPGADYPKTPSTAFAEPSTTRLGKQLAKESARHPNQSGFRILPQGTEGLLLRTQLVRFAERSIDIQYYIFAEDDTGNQWRKRRQQGQPARRGRRRRRRKVDGRGLLGSA